MSGYNFRERALELRGFIYGYLSSNGTKPGAHTQKTLEFLDDFLAAEPQVTISTLPMCAEELEIRIASIGLPEAEPIEELEADPLGECDPDQQPEEPTDHAGEPPASTESPEIEPEFEPVKQKRAWSDESRAAAAERMRARQAAGLMKRAKPVLSATASPPATVISSGIDARIAPKSVSQPSPYPKTAPTIDHERLITVHSGYAGKREDGQLTDSDWPDIKSRLSKGDTKAAITSDYDVGLEDLDFFISSNQRREAKQPPGEARASLPSQTSGAN